MKVAISPTTIIGYVRLLAAAAIVGKPLYNYWTQQNWNAASETIIATAAMALVNGILAAVAGHFTADSPPGPKESDSPASKIVLILLTLAVMLGTSACAYNWVTGTVKGAPKLDDGQTQIENACVIDAIVCFNDLKSTGADPQILQIDYVIDNKHYGHWMCMFSWPPPPGADNSADYIFDRTNKSTPIPGYVDPNSAFQVARFSIPQTVPTPSTRWITPKEVAALTPPKQ